MGDKIVKVNLMGMCIAGGDLEEMLLEQGRYSKKDLWHMYGKEKVLQNILRESNSFLTYTMAFWNGEFYIGRDVSTFKDEENIGDIRESVEKEIIRIFNKLIYCFEPCEIINKTFDFSYQEELANM